VLVQPTRDRAAERRQATRQEIVDAAWALAREKGLADFTLREVADRVGMRAPSLYGHVASKHAIYDLMFGQAWSEYAEGMRAVEARLPADLAGTLRAYGEHFVSFALTDPVRNQLMNQRTIPGFEPSEEMYAPAVAVLESLAEHLAERGVSDQEDIDLMVALVGGLADSQLANDPGGDRWTRLLPRAIDMLVRDIEDRSTP
jgi:AcrR family transcriptional regulator